MLVNEARLMFSRAGALAARQQVCQKNPFCKNFCKREEQREVGEVMVIMVPPKDEMCLT